MLDHKNDDSRVSSDPLLDSIILNDSHAGDYQREADSVVSLKRMELSVFGLHGLTARNKYARPRRV